MLSCSIWFSAPNFWMGGGLESRCVGRVYGADGAVRHHPHRTHGLEKTHLARCVFSKPCTKLMLHCNHRSGHLKTEQTESLFQVRRHLENWPRSPAVSMRSELLVAHEKLGQLLLLTV